MQQCKVWEQTYFKMKYYIIPKDLALKLKQVVLVWHTGVDGYVEIENGNFILSEWGFQKLGEYKKQITVNDKEIQATSEILKCTLTDEKNIIFKTYEQIGETEIIKGK